MILRRIQVAGWRCFADRVIVPESEHFCEGLNVIHGRNGSGKSTLLWALTRCLFDGHKVGGSDIQSLRPWGRSLNPHATVEFAHQGHEYRIEKRFLGEAMAELSRLEDGQFVRLAEGVAADQQVREMLSGEQPGRGVTDHRHWGFAQVLWATQGALRIKELSDGTRNTIQEALGAQVSGPIAGQLGEIIDEEYSAIYTGTGKLRGGAAAPPVVGLQSQLDEAKERREVLLAKLEAFDTASRKIEDLRNQTRDARQREDALGSELKKAREGTQIYQRLSSEQRAKKSELESVNKDFDTLQQRIEAIENNRKQLTDAEADVERLQQDSPAQAKVVEQAKTEAETARDELQSNRIRRAAIDENRRMAERAKEFVDAQISQKEANRIIEQINSIDSELKNKRKQREEIVAPDAAAIRKIKKAIKDRDEAKIELESSLIHVEILPDAPMTLEIERGEEVGKQELIAGQPIKIEGSPDVAFKLPGVGYFRAGGPSGSAEECREKLSKLERKVQTLTVGYGTRDVEQLETLHQRAVDFDREIESLSQQIDVLLGDCLRQDVVDRSNLALRIINEAIAEFTDWQTSPPQPDTLAAEAETSHQQFTADTDAAEARRDKAEVALRRAEIDEAHLESNLFSGKRRVADVAASLADLCGQESDAVRKEHRKTITRKLAVIESELEIVETKLQKFGDDPTSTIDTLEKQCDTLRKQVTAYNDKLKTEEGSLQTITAEAPYSVLNAEEEKLCRLEDDIKRHERHNNAIRLLKETIWRCNRDVVEALIQPVQARVQRTLNRIQGNRFEGIEFDDSFLPRGIVPKSHGEPVALDYLSGGEQEQVHFAVRLALADVAFQDDRQLLVLDDAFTFTDSAGLARIVAILSEAAQRFQIVLLSCHPERYAHLPDTKFFDLEVITAGQQHDAATSSDLRVRNAQARAGA